MMNKFKFRLTVYTGEMWLKSYRVLFCETREYTSSRHAWQAVTRISNRFNLGEYGNIGIMIEMV